MPVFKIQMEEVCGFDPKRAAHSDLAQTGSEGCSVMVGHDMASMSSLTDPASQNADTL